LMSLRQRLRMAGQLIEAEEFCAQRRFAGASSPRFEPGRPISKKR